MNWRSFCLSVCFAAAMCGCSSAQYSPPPPPPISVSVTPQNSIVAPSQTTQLVATVKNDTTGVTWSVNNTAGGNSTVGTIDPQGNYTAPSVTQSMAFTVTAISKADISKSAAAAVSVIVPGVVAPTNNPQVALYTIAPPTTAKVSIEFGLDTNYGLTTWQVDTAMGGGPTSIYVAGMKAATPYHIRAK